MAEGAIYTIQSRGCNICNTLEIDRIMYGTIYAIH